MIKHYLRLFCFALLTLNSGIASADQVSMSHEEFLPLYAVSSNNAAYTKVFGGIGDVDFSMKADAGSAGGVKTVHIEGGAKAYDAQGTLLYELHDYEFSVPDSGVGFRPKIVTREWGYTPTAQELVTSCNALADKLRQNGHSNQSIFGQDRSVKITVTFTVSADFSVSTFDTAPVVLGADTTLTCKKFAGLNPDIPPVNPVLQQTPGVSSVNLELQEIATLGGTCKVGLSGEIETNVPNFKVRYRFEHHDGKQSEIKELTTGADKKGSFNFQYGIPNGPGPEGGSIKLIGVNQDFESNQVGYSMDCKEPGPGSLKPNPQPKVTVDDLAIGFAVSQASIKLNKQHFSGGCPMTVYAIGSITTNTMGDVIYRVLHNGKAGPQRKLTISNGGNQVFTYPLVLQELGASPVPPGGGTIGGFQNTTPTPPNSGNSGPVGNGGITANQDSKPIGHVRIQILSPKAGVKQSAYATYTLNCKTPFTSSSTKLSIKKPTVTPGKTIKPPAKKPTTGQPKVNSGQKKNLINNKWYKLRAMSPEGKEKYTHLRINGQRVELKNVKNKIVKAPDGRYTLYNGYILVLKHGRIR